MKHLPCLTAVLAAAIASLASCSDPKLDIPIRRPEFDGSRAAASAPPTIPAPCPSLPASSKAKPRGLLITKAEALSDIDIYFTLLRYAYSGYFHFGGDVAFGPAKERAIAALEKKPELIAAVDLESALAESLSFIRDGHLSIGNRRFDTDWVVYLNEKIEILRRGDRYFRKSGPFELALESVDGKPPSESVVASIARDGRYVHRLGAYLPVEEGSSRAPASIERELVCALPLGIKIKSMVSLDIMPDVANDFGRTPSFKLDAPMGYPVISLRSLTRQDPKDTSLDRFAAAGASVSREGFLIIDNRRNPGGGDQACSEFAAELLGFESPPINLRDDYRASALGRVLADSSVDIFYADNAAMRDYIRPIFLQYFYAKPEEGSIWRSETRAPLSTPAPREGLILFLADRGTASAGESFTQILRQVQRCLTVGAPTGGVAVFSNASMYRLPSSGLYNQFSLSLSTKSGDFRETEGFAPDLWVPATEAFERASAFEARYGREAIAKAIRIEG